MQIDETTRMRITQSIRYWMGTILAHTNKIKQVRYTPSNENSHKQYWKQEDMLIVPQKKACT